MKCYPILTLATFLVGVFNHAPFTYAQGSSLIFHPVPFTPQAPLGRWSDAHQQNGCEEASSLMAVRWARGKSITPKEAERKIIALSIHQQKYYGSAVDTSAQDTLDRIIKGYFKHANARTARVLTAGNMIAELNKGNVLIVPVNGRILKNPHYKPPGPLYHMLVVIGYDGTTNEFVTNDPGTRNGKGYRYSRERLMNALMDYPTGNHLPIMPAEKRMIIVGK